MNNIFDTQHVSFTSLYVCVCGSYSLIIYMEIYDPVKCVSLLVVQPRVCL